MTIGYQGHKESTATVRRIEAGREAQHLFRSSTGSVDDLGRGTIPITWWKATASGRVRERQKFYGYKHPLKH